MRAISGGGRGGAGQRGLTLLELLLVMGLIGLLLGIGAGAFATLDFGRRAAVGLVQNVVRSARNAAVARAAPARVRIDAARGAIRAEALEVVGTWRFESERLQGAFGLDGALHGAELTESGYIGQALSLAGSRAAYAEFPVHQDPSFDPRDGFALECALRPGASGGGVLALGQAVGMSLSEGGSLRAWFTAEVESKTGERRAGGRVFVESPPDALARGRWSRVAVHYDRRLLRLWIAGVEVARAADVQPVWILGGPLRIGDPRGSFDGALDDLSIAVVAAGEEAVLPLSVRFGSGTPAEILFDARGHLDRELHRERVAFELLFEDGSTATVKVGLYGTVE